MTRMVSFLAAPRGWGTPLYKLYIMCRPIRSGFVPFWSEKGIHFAHFGLKSGMIFEGTTGPERINVFIVSIPDEKEREICEFEMGSKNFFVCALI